MKYILSLLIIALSNNAFSLSEPAPTAAVPNTLQQQYTNLKSDLEIIDGYRMIKMYTMDRFWAIVVDSLRSQKLKNSESFTVMTKQKTEIRKLNTSLSKIENEKQALVTRVDNIVIFGNTFPKAAVISVSGIVIIGLLVLSGILFSISRVSFYASRELRKLNEDLNQEFDAYKRNAVEKEIKLSRELQNYRNRIAELKTA